jgi:hypothetical protein
MKQAVVRSVVNQSSSCRLPLPPAVVCSSAQAMDGSMNLEQALEERLRIINCTPADIKRFIQAHPPSSRLVPVRAVIQQQQQAAAVCSRLQ